MIHQFLQERFIEMKDDLELFSEVGDLSIKNLQGSLGVVKTTIDSVRKYILGINFKGEAEEIEFFKYDKPLFYAERIFLMERYTIDGAVPTGNTDVILQYYIKELAFIDRFFYQYRFLYQYYQLNASELDHLYFLRSGQPQIQVLSEQQDTDPSFSTPGDLLFAKFIAYERLREYLLERMHQPDTAGNVFNVSKKGRELKWTGDKSNLIELAYGIYNTDQINGGEVDISDIIDWLEQSLQINLSRYYRRFSEIKARKSISKTKYLDEMRLGLLQYIDEGDAYKPKSPGGGRSSSPNK